jgi:hypothetical protein
MSLTWYSLSLSLSLSSTQVSYFGRKVHSHDYSITEYYEDIEGKTNTLPGVILMYEPWPIRVTKAVSRLGVLHLLVRLCAVVGGLWTVCGILNRSVHGVVVKLRKRGAASKGGLRAM